MHDPSTTSSETTDLAVVKQRQQQMWGNGDYADVGARILLVSELLCDAIDLRAGERVLDVACGTGNTSLAAARRFAEVTGVDYSPRLLDQARRRCDVEGLPVELREGDAEDLPFPDGSFDVVLSSCGAMFAPDQERAAHELLRVCRPGGRIGMVNWTPDSWVGEVGRTVGRYLPPPPCLRPPVGWGDRQRLQELLGHGSDVRSEERTFLFRFPPVEEHVRYLESNYPPIAQAAATLDDEARASLRRDLGELARRMAVSTETGLVLPLQYLEVVATRRRSGTDHV